MRETGIVVLSARLAGQHDRGRAPVRDHLGSQGPEQDTAMYPRLLNQFIGTKFKIVYGYKGQPDIFHAVEHNELHGLFMSGRPATDAPTSRPDEQGEMKLLLQFQPNATPDTSRHRPFSRWSRTQTTSGSSNCCFHAYRWAARSWRRRRPRRSRPGLADCVPQVS